MPYNPQGMTDGKIKVVTEKGFFPRTETPRPNQVGKSYTSKTGLPNTVLSFSKDETHYHPAQKPVALMEYMIRTYTNEGDTVLDNCMGSGTTGVACMNTGRKFIGIEMDEEYFAIAEKRIQEAIRL
jgi:site-specific DNA-methyltransferase (adenine-specific)